MSDIINEDLYKEFKCTSYNPYGFWKVSNSANGTAPEKLSGQYTTLVDCHKAIDAYLRQKEVNASKSAALKSKEKVLAKKASEEAAA